jgi:hypothetical protein
VVDRLFVDGLKVRPVPRLNAWLLLEEEAKKAGKKEALVEVETVAPLVALVAVVAVVALPESAAVMVPAEKLPLPSRKTKVDAVLVERADGIYSTLQEAAVVPEVRITVAIR